MPIETDYLLDVLPQEMGTYYHPVALQAQAIAARTYAYWHIDKRYAIYNSNGYQAFIPLKFQSLNTQTFIAETAQICQDPALNTDQRTICAAVAPQHYISFNGDGPAFSEFTGDAFGRTQTNSTDRAGSPSPYLLGIDDPISTVCDANDYGVNLAGMSQEGASRWARGNQCSFTAQGDMPWSVHWERTEQILTHYYTGIHIRDGNGNILTPQYRWVPLWLSRSTSDGQPIAICGDSSTQLTVRLQNTGTLAWTPQTHFNLSVRTPWNGAAAAGLSSPQGLPQEVAIGGEVTKTVTIQTPAGTAPGVYTVRLDMAYLPNGTAENPVWFSERETSRPWPTYDFTVKVLGPCRYVFVPTILSPGVAAASSGP